MELATAKGPQASSEYHSIFRCADEFSRRAEGLSARSSRSGNQILMDLVAKATAHGTRVLGLFVDEDNKRAIKFYELAGFMSLTSAAKKYRRMFLYLKGQRGGTHDDMTSSEGLR